MFDFFRQMAMFRAAWESNFKTKLFRQVIFGETKMVNDIYKKGFLMDVSLSVPASILGSENSGFYRLNY